MMRPSLHRATLTSAAVDVVAELLSVDAAQVSTATPFTDLGLSSTQLVQLTAHFEDAIGTEVPATALFDHPSIEQLVDSLVR